MKDIDETVVEAFCDGDDLAFVSIYQQCKKMVYAFCLKMVRDPDRAADIVQGVFLKIYERRHQLLHLDRFTSWLMMIARNECLSSLKRSSYYTSIPEDSPEAPFVAQSLVVEQQDEIAIVNTAIGRLKPDFREVVILRDLQSFSYKEIAEIIGVSESVVKSRLFTARQQLYAILEPVFAEGKKL